MGRKALKCVIAALVMLITCTTTSGCPTCEGRLKLGIKKPFFELYRPQSRSKYAPKRQPLREVLSFKKTDTTLPASTPVASNIQKE